MSDEAQIQQELFDAAKMGPEPEATPTEVSAPEPSAPEPSPEPEPTQSAREESIPSWRLREESEARRVAEDRARAFETRLAEIQTHMRQQEQQNKKPVPDFFEDPRAAIEAAIDQRLQPIVAETRRAQMQTARDIAEWRHGPENVELAERVFMQARDQRMLDPADYERVVRAPNRYDAVVGWYKRMYAQHTVGDDPHAWWQSEFETRIADPAFQAQVMERIRGSAAARPGVTKLPPTLSKSTAASSNGTGGVGDLSHDSLWASAMK